MLHCIDRTVTELLLVPDRREHELQKGRGTDVVGNLEVGLFLIPGDQLERPAQAPACHEYQHFVTHDLSVAIAGELDCVIDRATTRHRGIGSIEIAADLMHQHHYDLAGSAD